jgi:hypothetical protein
LYQLLRKNIISYISTNLKLLHQLYDELLHQVYGNNYINIQSKLLYQLYGKILFLIYQPEIIASGL